MKLLILVFSLIVATIAPAAQTSPPDQASTPSVSGKVLQDPDGQPIRKADVQLNGRRGRDEAKYAAVTNAEGQFSIDDVQPGRYDVVVERPGFVQSVTGGRRIMISVQAGSEKNDLILHMQPAAVISGKIVDLDGDPMRDVSVSATRIGATAERRNSIDSATEQQTILENSVSRTCKQAAIGLLPPHRKDPTHRC